MSNLWTARWTGAFLLWSVTVLMGDARCWADEGEQVKAAFFEPTREYATAPLWVWNDDLTAQQIRETLQDLAGQQVRQAFVHPRPGLMTPYLSEEWFALWKVCLRKRNGWT